MNNFSQITSIYEKDPRVVNIIEKINGNKTVNVSLKGTKGSQISFIANVVLNQISKNHLFIFNDREEAAYYYNDLVNLRGDSDIYYFPSSYKRSIQFERIDNASQILRTEILDQIKDSVSNSKRFIIFTYPEAIAEKVIAPQQLEDNTLSLSVAEKINIDFIQEVLTEYKFTLVDFVYEPGQFSIRGSIVDIFSFSNPNPYRIDFFGNEVESIRTFHVDNQLSINLINKISIVPNLETDINDDNRVSIFEYFPKDSLFWIKDPVYSNDVINTIFEQTNFADKQNTLLETDAFIKQIASSKAIFLSGTNKTIQPEDQIEFDTNKQPGFNKNFELLSQNIKQYQDSGFKVFILTDNVKQIERLNSIFTSIEQNVQFIPLLSIVHEGFIDHDNSICVYTDHEIFDRYHKFKLHRAFDKKESLSIKELTQLNPGDYVVHTDHGIGRFGGLETIDVNGRKQEAIKLVYRDNDSLYVNIHSLHKVSKYKGKDSTPPKIYKLGSAAWSNLKQKTKNKVKDIAKELIDLYAKRRVQKGMAFSPDTYLQSELEASFIYEDTPDQAKATESVKKGMEADYPMDHLVCGDVGFGKTEVAIRAAFKAVSDNKQVAVLVPTTILAWQHYKTFTDRLKDFPCNIDYISRLKKASDLKISLKKLTEGKTDIVIGTHRLVSKDIKFKDLGLLIVDEEQKFGVSIKEKLKSLKVNVDTLTLTATPIPRTLQFSLMGARDLSVINTPPPNRHPIMTELHTFNDEIIKEGVDYEVSRGGQVFFIHNRVQNIYEVEAKIKSICPRVNTVVAHGQMEGPKLEKIMLDFINGDYDILIATTIVESGLDIPNANTIFIHNAQNFGLSDLHQLRGRVGRSNKKAFCYLLAPPLTTLTPEARRRLKAIEEFAELGSGFNIALHDLDIRGAGNLLGGEQSGFITDIGYETYQRILDEAMIELKENEYKDIFSEEEPEEKKNSKRYISDCSITTDLEILFPQSYIRNIAERINLYRELDNMTHEAHLVKFRDGLIDRFGKLPEESEELLNIVRLRWLAIELGFEKILLKNHKLTLYFVENEHSGYYQSPIFANILQHIQENPARFKIKQHGSKLSLHVESIKNITDAINLLANINENVNEPVN